MAVDLKDFKKALSSLSKKYDEKTLIKNVRDANLIKSVTFESPLLNYVLGGKYVTGRIMQLFGPESSGKSTVSTYIGGQLQKLKPEQPIVLYVDFERTFDPNFAQRLGLNLDEDHFVLVQPDTMEDGFEIIEELVKTGKVCFVIFDSEAAAPTRKQADSEYGQADFGIAALQMTKGLKKLNIQLAKYDTSMTIISQERDQQAMSHAIVSCVTPDTMINIKENTNDFVSFSMEDLFKKVGLTYNNMTPYEFYDISDKNIYTKSFDTKSKQIENQKILSLVYKGEDSIYEVKNSIDNKVLLKASGNHLIFDNGKQDYVKLNEVNSIKVLLDTGESIDTVVVNTGRKEPVLDLEIEKNHNYYPNNILSHNTGGRALKFYASTRNRVTKVDTIEKNGETAGIKLKVRNYKNKTGIMFREAELTLYFDKGFDSDAEYMDFFIKLGIVKQAGAWFSYFKNSDDTEPMFKCAGRDKMQTYFDEHKDEFIICKNRVNELLSKESEELDSDRAAPPEARADQMEESKTASELAALAAEDESPELNV